MTMNKIRAKLRKQNKGQYRLLGLCVFLSVFLVSSFTLMFFSQTVQELLPRGGDTRKLMWILLGVVVIGCLLFTLYGGNLFFRNKGREVGVMLALGERKKELAGQLCKELAAVMGKYVFWGVLCALPMSYSIWKAFQLMIVHTAQMEYRIGMAGLGAGLCFAALDCLCILFMGSRFIRRANIMDILNARRKTEMVREVKPWCGKLGVALVVAGFFLAIAAPPLMVRFFRHGMPGIWNGTYLLGAAGVYLIMLSAVARCGRGKNPEKYYKNIISVSLMRFTARQTTRNMCVIAFLVFVMALASFWGVMYYSSAMQGGNDAPYDYSMHYPAKEEQIGEEEIRRLAAEHQVKITSYEELETLELVIQYIGRDMDEDHRYFDVEYKKLASFISASDFERISGCSVSLGKGEYMTIITSGFVENIWVDIDCLETVENPATGSRIVPLFRGSVEFDNLTAGSEPFAFLISDEDYLALSKGLPDDRKEEHVLFNVEDVMETYAFADAWKQAYIARATKLSSHCALYDAYEEELALAAGKEYPYAGEVDLSPDNMQLMGDWKYAPFSKVTRQGEVMELVAVFVLSSIYISVIALASAGIMSYVRSITIAIENRQLFEDLKRLGADEVYEGRVIKIQLRKLFAYPIGAGCIAAGGFSLLLTYFNDMRLQLFEVKMLLMEVVLMLLISGIMYGVYRIAFKKMICLIRDKRV